MDSPYKKYKIKNAKAKLTIQNTGDKHYKDQVYQCPLCIYVVGSSTMSKCKMNDCPRFINSNDYHYCEDCAKKTNKCYVCGENIKPLNEYYKHLGTLALKKNKHNKDTSAFIEMKEWDYLIKKHDNNTINAVYDYLNKSTFSK